MVNDEEELDRQPLTEAERRLIEERLAADVADPTVGVPWEVVKAEALARFKR